MANGEFPYLYCPRTGEECTSCTSALSTYIVRRMFKERPGLPRQKRRLVEAGIKQIIRIQEAEPRPSSLSPDVDCRQRLINAREEAFELVIRGMPEFEDYPLVCVVPSYPAIPGGEGDV